jgi:hypothetical protein
MKTIYTLLTASVMIVSFGCRNTNKPAETKAPTVEYLSKEQTEFINYWAAHFNTQKAPLLSLFRNRHISKRDVKEMDLYFKKKDSTVNFTDAIESLKIKTELAIDTLATSDIRWIDDHDVTVCNQVDPDFWNCFMLRYPIEGFYYISQPLFSADKKWCLVSVNYLSKLKKQSFGGGRLYHRTKNDWEEMAFLSYWGKQPE